MHHRVRKKIAAKNGEIVVLDIPNYDKIKEKRAAREELLKPMLDKFRELQKILLGGGIYQQDFIERTLVESREFYHALSQLLTDQKTRDIMREAWEGDTAILTHIK